MEINGKSAVARKAAVFFGCRTKSKINDTRRTGDAKLVKLSKTTTCFHVKIIQTVSCANVAQAQRYGWTRFLTPIFKKLA